MLRTLTATRYVTPLREGGSVPAIVEADDDGMYVLKFRGAAQGAKTLVAEVLAGEIGRALGLPIPEIVLLELDPVLGRSEPHYEIQELIKKSAGLNAGLDFLPGSLPFDANDRTKVDAQLASAIVWFDAYVTNVDRTPRNTNMLLWHRRPFLIDHGAALYFHHSGSVYQAFCRSPFRPIKDHVLLPLASQLQEADARMKALLSREVLEAIAQMIPTAWLEGDSQYPDPEMHREAYVSYLLERLEHSEIFVQEGLNARAQLV
ncbi:hypothetical protein EI42_04198 [Thermosporothrix hazakensis]|uniref:HipA-like kinase domain-containing protein n=1 Tax=Thermosporothrix hazakensis TaxID=644383 RepID=A0A326UBY6_THEHA|nr:HipA family kinase [Thermosporothrix hazakensis]PZW25705.1 hypothetical protein EI42_04198 [Thermosporothrix hazakensis]GCE48200.1 hypothetical protein KTH_30690 [Thermosporothrix hazakensis]